jgi:hypothetical protein
MADRRPTNKQALEDLLSGDETRIILVLSTYVIDLDGGPSTADGNEHPPPNGSHNCIIDIIPQAHGQENIKATGVARELQFKRASPGEMEEAWVGGWITTSAFYFPPQDVNKATTDTMTGCNLDNFFQHNQLPNVNFPCICLPPRLTNGVLVWTKDNSGLPRICVLKPTQLNHGDDVGRNMHKWAFSIFCPAQDRPWVMGPDDYRRVKGEDYKAGGMRTQDFCNVIGIWFSGSWHIYAQKTRPHKSDARVSKVVVVWELYPSYRILWRRS